MRKVKSALLSLLLLPFLCSNSPAPGPSYQSVDLEFVLDQKAESTVLTIENDTDQLIADISIYIPYRDDASSEARNNIPLLDYRDDRDHGYFLTPESTIKLEISNSLLDEENLSGWRADGLVLDSEYLIEGGLSLDRAEPDSGNGRIHLTGTVQNPSEELKGYTVLAYVETIQGPYGTCFDCEVGKGKSLSFEGDMTVPVGYETSEVKTYLILNNSYYSRDFNNFDLEDPWNVVILVTVVVAGALLIGGVVAGSIIAARKKKREEPDR